MTFSDICEQVPDFQSMEPRTVTRNYNLVKENGGNCYYDGRKGKCGRKKAFSEGQLEEAEERLESGELIDGEDVRRVMFPDKPAHTVCLRECFPHECRTDISACLGS
jgi:hypothetical protein